jgi:hypothetical protein
MTQLSRDVLDLLKADRPSDVPDQETSFSEYNHGRSDNPDSYDQIDQIDQETESAEANRSAHICRLLREQIGMAKDIKAGAKGLIKGLGKVAGGAVKGAGRAALKTLGAHAEEVTTGVLGGTSGAAHIGATLGGKISGAFGSGEGAPSARSLVVELREVGRQHSDLARATADFHLEIAYRRLHIEMQVFKSEMSRTPLPASTYQTVSKSIPVIARKWKSALEKLTSVKIVNLKIVTEQIGTDSGEIVLDGTVDAGKLHTIEIFANFYEKQRTPTFSVQDVR